MKKFCLLALLPVFMTVQLLADAETAKSDLLDKSLSAAGNVASLVGGYVVGSALGAAVEATAEDSSGKFAALTVVSALAVHKGAKAQVIGDLLGANNTQLAEVAAAAGFVLGAKPVQQLYAAAKGLCPFAHDAAASAGAAAPAAK